MPILILTQSDAGSTIPVPIGGTYQVYGTNDNDNFSITNGADVTIRSGTGNDKITLGGSITDYTVKSSGTTLIFTNTANHSVIIPLSLEADTIKFGDASSAEIRIEVSATGTFLRLGTQTVTSTTAPITGVIVTPVLTNLSIDNKGTTTTAETIDASTDSYNLTDAVAEFNDVQVTGYSSNDKITVFGATSAQYDASISTNAVGDVTIAYNNNGTLNQIALIGIAAGALVYDVASFNALPVGDIFFG